ncbi:hypothetical protein E4U60_000779 [Claviceps pazoutovae]|uniref:Uncharacterized protein n=1 Tax=Claviceps pazoutovae TaxID=1649127 RepID=A0A9P7MDL9_9HYPO|nr:hypothetical protein E4U60_000779 [Claviceps pazoutovae]
MSTLTAQSGGASAQHHGMTSGLRGLLSTILAEISDGLRCHGVDSSPVPALKIDIVTLKTI